jgi:hypothetical protein
MISINPIASSFSMWGRLYGSQFPTPSANIPQTPAQVDGILKASKRVSVHRRHYFAFRPSAAPFLFRRNAKPIDPTSTKIAPAIISQYGYSRSSRRMVWVRVPLGASLRSTLLRLGARLCNMRRWRSAPDWLEGHSDGIRLVIHRSARDSIDSHSHHAPD